MHPPIKYIRNPSLYRELKLIGVGTYAKVYLGENVSTGEFVAMKKVKKEYITDMLIETNIGKSIPQKRVIVSEIVFHSTASAHLEGVTKLISFYETKAEIVLIMEYYPKNLSEYIEYRRRLDESEAKILFKQLVETMYGLEKLNIFHGDLKSNNIMMSAKFEKLFVTDFGLATKKNEKCCNSFIGTLIPPECIQQQQKANSYFQIDATMFSLGWILFEMVCGNIPNYMENSVLLFNVEVSPNCKTLIRSLLSYTPCNRLRNFDLLLAHPFFLSD